MRSVSFTQRVILRIRSKIKWYHSPLFILKKTAVLITYIIKPTILLSLLHYEGVLQKTEGRYFYYNKSNIYFIKIKIKNIIASIIGKNKTYTKYKYISE